MASVNMPQRKQSGSGNLLSIAGAGLGALAGGPAGAGLGMQLGGMAGGMMNQPQAQAAPVESSALSRRKMALDQSPLRQIRESIDSLQYIPDPQQRAELAKPLLQADYMARNKR